MSYEHEGPNFDNADEFLKSIGGGEDKPPMTNAELLAAIRKWDAHKNNDLQEVEKFLSGLAPIGKNSLKVDDPKEYHIGGEMRWALFCLNVKLDSILKEQALTRAFLVVLLRELQGRQ